MNPTQLTASGRLSWIAGPVIGVSGLTEARLFDVVRVGEMGLVGEVIRLSAELATIQIYEDTSGIQLGEAVRNSCMPLSAILGPGLLGSVFDGLQRPLKLIAAECGNTIQRGVSVSPLSEEATWHFVPTIKRGDVVGPGETLGLVQESRTIKHHIMMPAGKRGQVVQISEGEFTINDTVAVLRPENDHHSPELMITLAQTWPVRTPRPSSQRLPPRAPLITGTRIIDTFFPVAKGGSAIIPGGFGTGKTVAEHSLARWADADVVVYVGCGERGNEMTDVLEEFPKLEDPRTGAPLMERTVLIANTSNMPVAAREASIYMGITIAEYYRDMGYDVLMLADSTSRWGEALREISGRLEEMPGEEGYPAYLGIRLAEFYERSGRVICLGSQAGKDGQPRLGSVTIVGAVSPPGGDFSEPITQNSMRIAGTFWALDYDLSRRRHFPAINWTLSYSLYNLQDWFANHVESGWNDLTRQAMALLQREVELLEIVQLVGPDALAENERAILLVTRLLREDFLQQSAYHPVDRFCSIEKAFWMLQAIMRFHTLTQSALQEHVTLDQINQLAIISEIGRMKELPAEQAIESIQTTMERIDLSFAEWGVE